MEHRDVGALDVDKNDVDALRAQRTRRAWRTTLTAVGGKAMSMLLSLGSVPLTLGFLDKERYGLWLMIGSMLTWLTVADLGLGYGLTRGLVVAAAADDREAERELVSTTTLAIGAVALVAAAVFAIAFPFAPWASIFAVSSRIGSGELHLTLALCAGIFFLGFPLGVVDKIYAGHQEGYISNYFSTANNVLSLAALILAVRFARGLPELVLALSGVPLVLRLLSSAYLFGKHRPWLRPRLSAFRWKLAVDQVKTGAAFLFLQLIALGMWQNDQIIVAQLFGVAEVGPYALGFRLGGFYVGLLTMWLDPLWPAYADAHARGDTAWIRASLRRTSRLAMAATAVAAVVVVIAGATVIRVWTRSTLVLPSRGTLIGVGGYMMVMAWILPYGMVLNGLGRIRGQMITGGIAAVVNIGLSIVLGRRFGPAGVCWATCLAALIPCVGIPMELHALLRDAPDKPQASEVPVS